MPVWLTYAAIQEEKRGHGSLGGSLAPHPRGLLCLGDLHGNCLAMADSSGRGSDGEGCAADSGPRIPAAALAAAHGDGAQ